MKSAQRDAGIGVSVEGDAAISSAAPLQEDASEEEDDPIADIARLERLHKYRVSKRQELLNTGLTGSKYDALKIQSPSYWGDNDSDDDEDGKKKQEKLVERDVAVFDEAGDKAKKDRIAKLHGERGQ